MNAHDYHTLSNQVKLWKRRTITYALICVLLTAATVFVAQQMGEYNRSLASSAKKITNQRNYLLEDRQLLIEEIIELKQKLQDKKGASRGSRMVKAVYPPSTTYRF